MTGTRAAVAPLRSFLPSAALLDELDTEPAPSDATALLVGLTRWAVELSERIDALPLAELAGIADTIEQHPLLRRVLGNVLG